MENLVPELLIWPLGNKNDSQTEVSGASSGHGSDSAKSEQPVIYHGLSLGTRAILLTDKDNLFHKHGKSNHKEQQMFAQLFGDKPWFKSLTAWGLLVFFCAQTLVPAAGTQGLIDAEVVKTLMGWMDTAAVLLTGLGIRKAASAPNVEPKT
jgi:hypothetical protein